MKSVEKQAYIRDRKNKLFDFSLHDSRIRKIGLQGNMLTFEVNYVFQYGSDGERHYEAEVIFTDCDPDDCRVLIFNSPYIVGKFSGQCMEMMDFINQYHNQEFEIITELHCGNSTIFQGWLWQHGKPVSAQLELYNKGDMIYRIGKEL